MKIGVRKLESWGYQKVQARNNVQKQYTVLDHSGNVHFLEATVLEKDSGIWSDASLKFSVHVTINVVNKAIQILGAYMPRLHTRKTQKNTI